MMTIALFLFTGAGAAFAVDVSPSNITGEPGDTVTMAITIDTEVVDMEAWGLDIYFDTDVLEYSSVDITDTLTSSLTSSGVAKDFGARVGAYYTNTKASGAAGTLLNVILKVKATAFMNSTIQFKNFADYVAGATTTNATFTITGVTTTITVTPASTTTVVAGAAVTLTAAAQVNGTDHTFTDTTAVTFAVTSGSGSFGTKTISNGNVLVDYTSHTTIETATITAAGISATGTAEVTSIAGPLTALTVSPDTAGLTADQTQQFTAAGVDANGNTATGTIVWTVTGSVGAIDNAGLFNAGTAGTGSVTATVGSVADTSGAITVTAGAAAAGASTVEATTSVVADNTAASTITVTAKDSDGNLVAGATVVLASTGTGNTITQPAAVTDASGLATGTMVSTKAESKTVSATISDVAITDTGTAVFTAGAAAKVKMGSSAVSFITNGTDTVQVTATIVDVNGNTVTDYTAADVIFTLDGITLGTFGAITTTVAAASIVNGVATATLTALDVDLAGSVKISATSGDLTSYDPATTTNPYITLAAINRVLDNIELAIVTGGLASTASPKQGETVQFKATGHYKIPGQDINPEFDTDLTTLATWASSDTAKGTIGAATGFFIAVAEGTTGVTATYEGMASPATTVTVEPAEAVVFDTAELPATIEVGDSVDFGAVISGGTGAGFTYTIDSQPTGDPGILTEGGVFSLGDDPGFAGVYVIKATDDNSGASTTHTIKVAIVIQPDALAITETKYDGTDNPQVFTVTGASSDYTWEIVEKDDGGDYQAVETPADYGTWANTSPVTDGNTNTLSPADVSEIKRFYIRVTVENDADLTEENGLNQLVVGLFSVVPLATYTVTVEDSTGAVDGSALTAGDITVSEEVTGQTKNLTATDGNVTFQLPDTSSTFLYMVRDTRTDPGYINREASSMDTTVTIALETAGDDTLTGTVQDTAAAVLANAMVMAYDPSDLEVAYEVMTDADGAYTIILPSGAAQSGWTVVAILTDYVSVKQADQAIGTVDFTGANGLQAKTTIASATATVVGTTVQLDITADPAFTAATEADVTVTSTGGAGALGALSLTAGTISAVYDAVEDFSVVIKADTSEDNDPTVGYSASRAFSYVAQDTATDVGQGEVDAGGGTVDLTTTGGQPAVALVPAGGMAKDATIVMKQVPKANTASTITSGSPTYVYEVTATDNSTGTELTDDEIVRIEITLPIDLSVIHPGDLEDGVYVIYYADDLATLEAGGATQVQADQIVSTDYVGDGQVGSVTFWLDHLSVLAIGLPSSGVTLIDQSNDSSSGCFIDTTAQGYASDEITGAFIPGAVSAVLAVVALLSIVAIRRFRKIMAGLTVVLACFFLVVNSADAEPISWYLENIKVEIDAGGLASNTSPKVGETVQLKAKGYYKTTDQDASLEYNLDFTKIATWSSSDTTKGNIGISNGLFKAIAEGSANVTATYEGMTSSAITMNVRTAAPIAPETEEAAVSPATEMDTQAAALIASPAESPSSDTRKGKVWYIELSGVYVVENIDADQTIAKFSGPITVDFDESWGAQLAIGHICSDMLAVEAMFEYVAPFEAFTGGNKDELDVMNASINAKLSYPAKKVKPYVAVGLGAMKAYEDIRYNGATSKAADWGLSFRGGAGVDVFVTDSISIDLEGAYVIGTGDVDHVKYTTISLGLAYHF